MHRSRDRSRSGGASLLAQATAYLNGVAPYHFWNFVSGRALFAQVDVGDLDNTPGWSFTRATVGTALTSAGTIVQFASGQPRITDRGILIEGARTNLFLNSATGVTQNVTVAAAAHTLSFWGTGTITLTGASTAGPLVGTGVNDRVTLTFTPTAGTLTLTISGSCTSVQLEAGAFVSSYIPTAGASVTRDADILTVNPQGVNYPLTLFATFTRSSDSGATADILGLSSGAINNRTRIYVSSTDIPSGLQTTANVLQAFGGVGAALPVGTACKLAMRVATNDWQICRDATLGTPDVVIAVPAQLTTLHFGQDWNGSANGPLWGYISAAAMLNSAAIDAQLQAMTT